MASKRQRRAALAFLLALGSGSTASIAHADENPYVVPQRDVDVVYAVPVPAPGGSGVSAPAAPMTQRIRFSAALAVQRVDPPGPGTYMLTDYARGLLTIVEPARRIVTTVPSPGGPIPAHGVRAHGAYRRLDSRTVSGLPCTDWETRDDSGHDSVLCLTDDGVMLQASQQGRILVQAAQVRFDPQDPALFQVPDGFRRIMPPPLPRAGQ